MRTRQEKREARSRAQRALGEMAGTVNLEQPPPPVIPIRGMFVQIDQVTSDVLLGLIHEAESAMLREREDHFRQPPVGVVRGSASFSASYGLLVNEAARRGILRR